MWHVQVMMIMILNWNAFKLEWFLTSQSLAIKKVFSIFYKNIILTDFTIFRRNLHQVSFFYSLALILFYILCTILNKEWPLIIFSLLFQFYAKIHFINCVWWFFKRFYLSYYDIKWLNKKNFKCLKLIHLIQCEMQMMKPILFENWRDSHNNSIIFLFIFCSLKEWDSELFNKSLFMSHLSLISSVL